MYAIEATRFEFEAVRDTKCSAQVNLGKDVPAVLALLPERPEKERKKGYFGAQVEGWCLARRAEFTDPVDGWQILVDPQQRARGVPRDSSPGTMDVCSAQAQGSHGRQNSIGRQN